MKNQCYTQQQHTHQSSPINLKHPKYNQTWRVVYALQQICWKSGKSTLQIKILELQKKTLHVKAIDRVPTGNIQTFNKEPEALGIDFIIYLSLNHVKFPYG